MDIWPVLPGCREPAASLRSQGHGIHLSVIVKNLAQHRGTILRFSSAKKIEHRQKKRGVGRVIRGHETHENG